MGWKKKIEAKKLYIKEKIQLVFSSKIKVPQLSSARLGTFIARAHSSRKIPARTHHYSVTLQNFLAHPNIVFHTFIQYLLCWFLSGMKNDYWEKVLVVFKMLSQIWLDLSTTPVFSYPFSQNILGLSKKFKGNKKYMSA